MPVPALGEQESAKLAMSESAKKLSDLKAKQWEIAKNAVVILAFFAAVSRTELKYPPCLDFLRYAIPCLVFAYFATIFQQASKNAGRYRTIYRKAAQDLFSAEAFVSYYKKDPEELIEDEGRLSVFLFVVVAVLFLLVLFQIYTPSSKPTGGTAGMHATVHLVPHADSAVAEMGSSWS
jgi:hypothetical protein